MNKLSRFVLLPLLSLAIIFVVVFAFAKPALADGCEINNSGEVSCTGTNYKYDPVRSLQFNTPVFVAGNDNGYIFINTDGQAGKCSNLNASPNQGGCGEIVLSKFANADIPFTSSESGGSVTRGPFCSLVNPKNCRPWDGDDYDAYKGPRDGDPGHSCKIEAKDTFGGTSPVPDKPCEYTGNPPTSLNAVISALAQKATTEAVNADCAETPLSFVICPVNEFLQDTFTKMIELVTKLLANPDLSSNDQLKTAVSGIVTIANSFYILIFLFIILANFIAIPALDNYTIKKTLPKLIAAIILTQFSLLICQAVLDLGNIIAVTLPQFLLTAFGIPGETPAVAFSNTIGNSMAQLTGGNIATQLGNFALLEITLVIGVVVSLIAFVYIIGRYLFLVGLVLICPLAFAAWVLPNTEGLFKKWWTYFIKLTIMFLLINLLFVLGAVFVKLLGAGIFDGTIGTFASGLVGVLIPIVILLAIPKTLKVSGDVMSAGGKALSNFGKGGEDSRVAKAVKKSSQEGKLAEVKGGAQEGFGKSKFGQTVLGGSRAARMEAQGAANRDKSKERVRANIEKLGLDRQIDLMNNGKGDVKAEAARAVTEKRRKLQASETLDGAQRAQLDLINQNGAGGGAAATTAATGVRDAVLTSTAPDAAALAPHATDVASHVTVSTDGKIVFDETRAAETLRAKGLAQADIDKHIKTFKDHVDLYKNTAKRNPIRSDRRLKRNIIHVQTLSNGIKLYRFKYIWEPTEYVGVMAQDLLNTKHANAVGVDEFGYYRVDYSALGLQMVTLEQYQNDHEVVLAMLER